jgi:phenol/toluene 2-monooxygenase (NADH) P4/A4
MSTLSLKPYAFEPADAEANFHGNRLLYIGWDDHLMFCAPICLPLPPEMPFGVFVADVLPGLYGAHPDFAEIDWTRVQWLHDGAPWQPDPARTLAENGLAHKDVIRLQTPGLTGIRGSFN